MKRIIVLISACLIVGLAQAQSNNLANYITMLDWSINTVAYPTYFVDLYDGTNHLSFKTNCLRAVTITNEYHPKQYGQVMCYATYPATWATNWYDGAPMALDLCPTREDPDRKIVEVWRRWVMDFKMNDVEYSTEFHWELVEKKVYIRKVETQETWEVKP